MPIQGVTDLRIYQQSMDLLPDLYRITGQVGERDLRNQTQRAARSIAANITEGFGRKDSPKEFKRFLRVALGSADEVQTHLRQINLLYQIETTELESKYNELSRQLFTTIQTWS